jgi:myo-inositol-1(or 4)-monophosphatase
VNQTVNDPLRDQLRQILQPAGRIALDHFGSVRAVVKPDGTQVTVADREVERAIVSSLQRAFPGDRVVSEEGGGVEGGGATWFVDPIDGTSAYIEGLAHWGPTVGRVVDGRLDVGALWLPRLGEFWYARRGYGAWRNGQRLRPGDPGEPGRHHSLFAPSRFHLRAPIPWPGKVRALGSSAAHLALVAAGAGLVAVIPKWHLWDVACGVLLVEEAGRRVCDASGNEIDVTSCRPGLPMLAGASTALHHLLQSGWTTAVMR